MHTSRREREVECVKVDERAREQEREDGHKWLRVSIAHYFFLSCFFPLFPLQLKQIEATNAAVRLLFRSLQKPSAKMVARPKSIVILMK